MADIKTRDAVKGTIKTIDKAAIASERMKSAYVEIKERAEQGYYADENSCLLYTSYIGELVFNMLVLVGAVKMADRVVREMMGL